MTVLFLLVIPALAFLVILEYYAGPHINGYVQTGVYLGAGLIFMLALRKRSQSAQVEKANGEESGARPERQSEDGAERAEMRIRLKALKGSRRNNK